MTPQRLTLSCILFNCLLSFSVGQTIDSAIITTGLTAGTVKFSYRAYPNGRLVRVRNLEADINPQGVAIIPLNVARDSLRTIAVDVKNVVRLHASANVLNAEPGNIDVSVGEIVPNIVTWVCGGEFEGEPIPHSINVRFTYEIRRKLQLSAPADDQCAAGSSFIPNYKITSKPAKKYTEYDLEWCQNLVEISSSYMYGSFTDGNICLLFSNVTKADFKPSKMDVVLISGDATPGVQLPSKPVPSKNLFKDHNN